MKLLFKSPAARELDDAFNWYEDQFPGLGFRFIQAFEKAVARIKVFPQSCAPNADGARHLLLQGFPYVVWYVLDDDAISIYAIAHTHREPQYWIGRLS